MDRLLRRALDGIAQDRRSGAAELVLRAVAALEAWLRRHPKPSEQHLLEIARALLFAQPSMAPLLRLANEVALALETPNAGPALARSTRRFNKVLRIASARISRSFIASLGRDRPRTVATYSYSSTVVKALIRARSRIRCVLCSEGRPKYEGRSMAARLGRAGIEVHFFTDAALMSALGPADAIALGADAVLARTFVNKIGTSTLVMRARTEGKPVVVLADTLKFNPNILPPGTLVWTYEDVYEIWRQAPNRVSPSNMYFEPTNLYPGVRVLTERGWMTPADVRRELQRIRVSPRLRAQLG